MSSLSRELVFLILQFLDEEKFKETVHRLEKESGFYFNMKYFEEAVTNGDWDEVEKYLLGFTKLEDNRYSMKIFFEIRKQKYLEALDKQDNPRALEILRKDLKVFSTFNEELYKEITLLLTLTNFRENEQLSKYGDTKSARAIMFGELKKLIEANPVFRDRLQFPNLKSSRLRTLINQSLNWQHQLCKSPKSNPDIKTLFVDHSCGQGSGARAPSPVTNQLMGGGPSGMPKVGGFPQVAAHNAFQPPAGPVNTSLGGWMAGPSGVTQQAISGGPLGLVPPNITASMLKRAAMDYQNADSEHALKRARLLGISEEGNNVPVNILPVTYPGPSHAQILDSADDLPKTVVANLNQGSAVKSMDFHPGQQTLLLVGTNMGDVAIWEIASRERLVYRNFKVRDLGVCSPALQASLANEYTASVNRVVWSPDGLLCGVAYSKHIVHIFSYRGGGDLRDHLEIDAHIGNVSDLAFAHPNKNLSVVTCGEDKTIKVWDAGTGNKQYTFEGHEAPVYSIRPHFKENIQFIFSTGIDGKIKAWLYDEMGSRVDYDAPGQSCTRMGYSSDGLRLFSCGTSKDGESYLVEWNETEGAVKRTYLGLGKRTVGVVQFDTTKNRFLAAGDEFAIKFWDMDNVNLLMTIDAEGGLPASPCIRFNKEGFLLAVSTSENGVKILGNVDAARLLRAIENRLVDASRGGPSIVVKAPMINTYGASSSAAGPSMPMPAMSSLNGDGRSLSEVIPRTNEELEISKIWKLKEITEPTQLRWLKLPDNMLPVRIIRLMYTHSGGAILALAYNAVHKLWRWPRNERNTTGKATTSVPPVLWQPSSGIIMTNDIGDTNVENSAPCFAISKNDSYIMSASGGKICLFNLMTFKTMTMFMPPPPAATFLAFHPIDNNVIAIGMDDSSIQIYNARVDEVKTKLKGHQKRVTGLAFSTVLNILVSSGSDAQLCVWSLDSWEKQNCKLLQIPSGHKSTPLAQTRVQFHQDQKQLLVVHETHLAIYEAPNLECINQWVVREGDASITDATYSCDSQSIFASFEDGSVSIFTSPALGVRCRISPMAYLPSNLSSSVYPLAITANPILQNQFALGLSDGGVVVLEPLEAEGKWGTAAPPPQENGVGLSSNGVAANPEQH